MRADELRLEYLVNPMGVHEERPRFSWIASSARRGAVQTAYQLIVASSAAQLAAGIGDVWDSGRIASSATAQVEFEGPRPDPDSRRWWAVRCWDADGLDSGWSDPAWWESGLLAERDWSAQWISAPSSVRTPADPSRTGVDLAGRRHDRPAWLRGRLTLDAEVARARVFVTARGVYELHINGQRVGDDIFTPGWTDFRQRAQYQVYDVTDLLASGDNVVGALLGDGWFCGRIAWRQRFYGDHPSLLVQLHVDLTDGRRLIHCSDGSWRGAASNLLWSDMLTGEAQDLGHESVGWATPVVDDSGWSPVEIEPAPNAAALVGQRGPTVQRLAELEAVAKIESAPGRFIVDFGQNMVGWVRLRVPAGSNGVVTVCHAEVLEADGSLYTANYRAAQCVDAYVLPSSDHERVLEPHFTWRGFRYVEVAGLPAGADFAIHGIVVGSNTPAAGRFECSSAMVTQLQRNIEWGQRGNFLEVPTDCPQRDERLGWLGDAQVFIPTACWNSDVVGFFTKWLDDVLDARSPRGAFPDVAPLVGPLAMSARPDDLAVEDLFAEAAPGWGDAGVIVPWVLYQRYGDRRLLERCFPAMARWVEYVREDNPDLLWRERRGLDYGDWLAVGDDTPRDVLATAYFARSAELVARAARVLGNDATEFDRLRTDIASAFNEAFVAPSGRIVGHTQTTYVLALAFGLLPASKVAAAAGYLVDLICQRRGPVGDFTPGHLSTGFLGVGHLLPVLAEAGELELAYRLLENETFPSWGYSIRHGATTIWERWDGSTDENGFQDAGMNSFNHYSLGSVGEWLFSTVAGIIPDPDYPGFERFSIRPRPGGSITYARASHRCIRGTIRSEWELTERGIRLHVVVPTNSTAEVWVPGASIATLTEGARPASESDGVELRGDRQGCAVVVVGGGDYEFAVQEG